MRVLTILILTSFYLTAFGQRLPLKYRDYFGHCLELKNDSTFRCEWHFDLISEWAIGRWTQSGRTITLNFIDVYDTLVRPAKQDSLILSIDDKSNRIGEEEFAVVGLISGGQYKHRFNDQFRKKGKRLYIVNSNGRLNRSRREGIWQQRKFPFGYKKWPKFYKRVE